MPRKLPLHVERNAVKGHTYLSFRRGKGRRIRLPTDPTSDEFMAAYQAALLGQSPPPRDRLVRAAPGTVGALIASWLLPRLGIYIGAGIVGQIIEAFIGAVILLIILRLLRR